MNVRVEYDCTPIRHIAVQCPKCSRWYHGRDITKDSLDYSYQINFAQFTCPVCGHVFGGNEHLGFADTKIVECGDADEVYKDCLQRKEVWE